LTEAKKYASGEIIMGRYQCLSCGRVEISVGIPRFACVCGVDNWLCEPVEKKAAEARAVQATAELPRGPKRVSTGEKNIDRLLGGGLPRTMALLLRGPEGSGKSRLALRWATASARALVVTLEMTEAQTRLTARSAGGKVENLWLLTDMARWEAEARRIGAEVVVVDSITASGRGALRSARAVQTWAQKTGGVGIIISHENKRGQVFGQSGLGYYLDATLRVTASRKGARVRVLKSRAGPVGHATTRLVQNAQALEGEDDPQIAARTGAK
jgi:DNA repair protein RadA/Sms